MMELERKRQYLLLEGKAYTPEDVRHLVAAGNIEQDTPMWSLFMFLHDWFNDAPVLTVQTSGSTGTPKKLIVRKDQMMQSARLTCEYLKLHEGDSALLCMNLRYIGAMMMVVRSLVAGLNLILRPASGHPLLDVEVPVRFAAMVPLQVYNTLQIQEEKEKLTKIDTLIIGGGAIDKALEQEIQTSPGFIYSTYGMTETLSHIALRRLNGANASDHYYPFTSVELSLSTEKTLIIHAPLLCDDVLQTNDVAHIYPDGSFVILGRKDNIINSGGIKIQAEAIEKELQYFLICPFVVTFVEDQRLGQAVTLLIAGDVDLKKLDTIYQTVLTPYAHPQYTYSVTQIPQTGNGKIDRGACHILAQKLHGAGANK